jgi:hypothetical protein
MDSLRSDFSLLRLSIRIRDDYKSALTPGGCYSVGCWTLRVELAAARSGAAYRLGSVGGVPLGLLADRRSFQPLNSRCSFQWIG